MLLGLYERANLAKDANVPAGSVSSTDFSLGIPAGSQADVGRLLAEAEAAGATLTAPAHVRPFGVYSGYFTDPDGHLWEIAWNSNGSGHPLRPGDAAARAFRRKRLCRISQAASALICRASGGVAGIPG
jgi:hypothetical protein